MKIFSIFVLALTTFSRPLSCFTGTNPPYTPFDDSLKIIEKVYLHVDRDSYYPGDDIWFKAYLVEASDRLLSGQGNNLYVELISPSLKIIDSRIVKINAGLGSGDFRLAENLGSGRYLLRAYTNYMRNFSDKLFFNKDIIIINTNDTARAFSDGISYYKNKPEITFFPEGGSLVENVTSRVAFKAVDSNGMGCDITGKVYSSTGELITTFKSTHKGMGAFSIHPVSGIAYYTVTKNIYGDSVKTDIPKSFSTGVVLSVSDNQEGEILLTFKTNAETLPLIIDQDLSLAVSTRNIIFKTYSFSMKSLNSFLKIPADDIPDGIVMLTLTGTGHIPLCERLVYIHNNEDIRVNLETNKPVYDQRDSVSIKISLLNSSRIPQDAFLSISATDIFFTDNSTRFPSTISSWFLLESDVRGLVEEPSYYFDQSNPDRLKDLDLLLLTQGWRDFEWKYKTLNYLPEYGFTISGRVRKKFTNAPVKNSFINIGIFNNGKPLIWNIPVDSMGKFYLKGVDLTGDAKLIASITGDYDNLKGWLLLDSARYSPAMVTKDIIHRKFIQYGDQYLNESQSVSKTQLIEKNMHKYIQYAEIKNSIRKKYKLSDTITPGEVSIIAKRQDAPESARARSRQFLMGTPDQELVITPEHQIYNDVFQLVGSKYLSGRVFHPAGTKARPLPPSSQSHEMQNPLYMINGMVASEEDVKTLSVIEVERIDVLDNMASYGVFGAGQGDTPIDGVISIILKSSFSANRTSIFHSVNIKFSGYNEPRVFYSPKHHAKLESDYKPDLRTTLFWEPNIKVGNNKDVFLNYYNSDNSSKIKVVVEGITTSGIPVTGTTEYEVR